MITEYLDEGVFDEDAKEMDIENRSWETLMSYRKKDGLRDGLSEGHDSCLQESFNQGFQDAFKSVYNISLLRGISRTFCLKKLNSDVSSEIYKQLGHLENSVLEVLKDGASNLRNNSQQGSVSENVVLDDRETEKINPPAEKMHSKKLEIEGQFAELKEKCLEIAKTLNDTELTSTISNISAQEVVKHL